MHLRDQVYAYADELARRFDGVAIDKRKFVVLTARLQLPALSPVQYRFYESVLDGLLPPDTLDVKSREQAVCQVEFLSHLLFELQFTLQAQVPTTLTATKTEFLKTLHGKHHLALVRAHITECVFSAELHHRLMSVNKT